MIIKHRMPHSCDTALRLPSATTRLRYKLPPSRLTTTTRAADRLIAATANDKVLLLAVLVRESGMGGVGDISHHLVW